MRAIAANAIANTRVYQEHNVNTGLMLLVIAGLLGLLVAAAITSGLVRPVRRLLAGTSAVENGALDTMVPVTSHDEIGRLVSEAFNHMVAELRVKAQIRETFGKYLDPRIVAALIERSELINPKGDRRDMTVLICDMQGFTRFSEGMTPAGLVNVLNRYLTVASEPVRRNGGIIDKYIGDAVMAYWGPPFAAAEAHAQLACFAALEQLDAIAAFESELPDLTGVRRQLLKPVVQIGIATGEVVVGNIGSEQTRSYTVIGDTVNIAFRLEGASKVYNTHVLISNRRGASPVRRSRRARLTLCSSSARASPSRSSNCSDAPAKSARNGLNCATRSRRHWQLIAAKLGKKPLPASAVVSRSCQTTRRARSFSPALTTSASIRRSRAGSACGRCI